MKDGHHEGKDGHLYKTLKIEEFYSILTYLIDTHVLVRQLNFNEDSAVNLGIVSSASKISLNPCRTYAESMAFLKYWALIVEVS